MRQNAQRALYYFPLGDFNNTWKCRSRSEFYCSRSEEWFIISEANFSIRSEIYLDWLANPRITLDARRLPSHQRSSSKMMPKTLQCCSFSNNADLGKELRSIPWRIYWPDAKIWKWAPKSSNLILQKEERLSLWKTREGSGVVKSPRQHPTTQYYVAAAITLSWRRMLWPWAKICGKLRTKLQEASQEGEKS